MALPSVDLQRTAPRRWNERVNGICWLPRMIDKARAYDAGALGHYLFGHSPVDNSLLGAARLGHGDVLEAVRACADDAGVLAELERRSPGATARMQAWSARPGPFNVFVFNLVDADEGYTSGVFPSLLRALPANGIAELLRRAGPRSPGQTA